jgi:hypothetical protein
VAKGTRVYVDGKMVGFVKRRRVDEAGAAVKATDGSDAFSLQAVVKTMGVDLTTAASFELLSGDEVVGRGTKDELVSPKGEIRFTLPKHAHGKILARIPDALQAKETSPSSKEITVTAIEIYRNSPVSKRTVSPVEDVFDVTQVSPEQLQAAIGTGSGRNNDL